MTRFTAVDIAAAVRDGSRSPTAAVERALERIARHDPGLGAFRRVRADEALAEAARLVDRPDLAELPLAGVPVAIKDNLAVAGESTRNGSTATDDTPASADHPVVARLRAAGAIVVGLTNVPELCIWGTTDSDFGITRNPWDPGRSPGGSSGGSAAAVAAGLVPIALGNDGMGSIRIPAANCGLVGIRPGRGLVPSQLGANSWFGMAENGPLATTVADAARMLSVLSGGRIAQSPPEARPLRIAVAPGVPSPLVRLDRQWAAGLDRVADALAGAGHTVTAAKIPYPLDVTPLLSRWCAGAAADAAGLDRRRLARRTRVHVALGRAADRLGLVRESQAARTESRVRELFTDYDVVLTPTLARCAPPALAWSQRSWLSNIVSNVRYAPYPALWNLLGWPAASVPAGVDDRTGLPLAVQIAAPAGAEETVLAVAAHVESLLPWQPVAAAYA